MIYMDGKPVRGSRGTRATMRPVVHAPVLPSPKVSDAWSWMPPHRLGLLINKAYVQAQKDCTPPDDEPLILDGLRYASKSDFARALVDSISDLIFERVAGLDGPEGGSLRVLGSNSAGQA